jgi:hypothetical protein
VQPPQAGAQEPELAAWPVERPQEQAEPSCGRIASGKDRGALRRALLEALEG